MSSVRLTAGGTCTDEAPKRKVLRRAAEVLNLFDPITLKRNTRNPIRKQNTLFNLYSSSFDMLGWIRIGHGIQNTFVKCQFHHF